MPDPLDVPFPTGGVDRAGEFGVQRPLTAPVGLNVRTKDPILENDRGGSRFGLAKHPAEQSPEGSHLIQFLGQLVVLHADLLLTTFEDFETTFVPDTRNPSLDVPPGGNAFVPNKDRPRATRRRETLAASATSAFQGQTVTLTATTTTLAGGAAVAGVTVTLITQPPGQSGHGQTGVTNGSGVVTFPVSETSFEGPVRYLAVHQFTPVGEVMPLTCRGACQVQWTPAYTMTLSSPDGTQLDADGTTHDLIAGLALTATNAAVPGRTVRLTTSPTGEVGHGKRGVTGSDGTVTFRVSDEDSETVTYTADLPPYGVVNDDLAIQWGVDYGPCQLSFSTASGSQPVGDSTNVQVTVSTAFTSVAAVGVMVTLRTTPGGGPSDGAILGPTDAGGLFNLTGVVSGAAGTWDYDASAMTGGTIVNQFPIVGMNWF